MSAQARLDAVYRALGIKPERILAPLAEGEGAGVDMRYTPEFDELAEMRREDSDDDQGIWQTAPKKADWKAVARQCSALLSTRTHDLQIAVWLLQAMIRLQGFGGLAAGCDLLARLCRDFWPVLWPKIDGDDMESRLAPFFWADRHLTIELLQVAVTTPADEAPQGINFQLIVKGRQMVQLATNNARAYAEAISEGELSPEDIEAIIAETPDEFFVALYEDLTLARQKLAELITVLDGVAGMDAPSLSSIGRTLGEIGAYLTGVLVARDIEVEAPAPAPSAAEAAADEDDDPFAVSGGDDAMDEAGSDEDGEGDDPFASADDTTSVPNAGATGTAPVRTASRSAAFALPAISSRREAYRLLDHAASWLIDHEPHSPVPFLVKRAVSWEGASLRTVLTELMARGADAETIMEFLAIDESGKPAGSAVRRTGRLFEE